MYRVSIRWNRKEQEKRGTFLADDTIAEKFAIDPPANRDGGGSEEDEEDGVAGAVASFVFDLAFAELSVKTAFTAAVGKVIGSGDHGTLTLALFAKLLRSAFD